MSSILMHQTKNLISYSRQALSSLEECCQYMKLKAKELGNLERDIEYTAMKYTELVSQMDTEVKVAKFELDRHEGISNSDIEF